MIIGSVAVSLVAVVALVVALTLNSGSDDQAGKGGASASASSSRKAGYRGPDRSRVIDKEKCTSPTEAWDDPNKVQLPDFRYKDINSVKDCIQAAGWKIKVDKQDDNTWGDGTVLNQFPSQGSDVSQKDPGTIEVTVSTGNPA